MTVFLKDPNAILDYKLDFANTTNGGVIDDWLETGETITTHTLTAPSGITVDSSSITDSSTTVTLWLSGGTAGRNYRFTLRITTSSDRTDDRDFTIKVRDR